MRTDIGTNVEYGYGNDAIVIRVYGKSIIGGRILEVEDFSEDIIRMGHVIIRDEENEVSKPLGVSEGAYVSIPEGYVIEGVSKTTTTKNEPLVGVMYEGEINDIALPFPLTAELRTALATACPGLALKHS